MRKLTNWNFRDKTINSGIQQVNRQKSALNLEVVEIDKKSKVGVFLDKKSGEITAHLTECECKDFVGRMNVQYPCQHIYRLAMEMGLMEITHLDYRTKIAMMSSEEGKAYYISRLQKIGRDYTQWGGWDLKVHKSIQQKVRQYRAYNMIEEEKTTTPPQSIANYNTSLESCSCPDFQERKLPCKHIYRKALVENIELHESHDDYIRTRDRYF